MVHSPIDRVRVSALVHGVHRHPNSSCDAQVLQHALLFEVAFLDLNRKCTTRAEHPQPLIKVQHIKVACAPDGQRHLQPKQADAA